MALPANPPISMAQVKAEFGGTGRLGDYLRGGPYVPNIPANLGVPASLPITLHQLCGATAAVPNPLNITLSTHSVIGQGLAGTVATPPVTATVTGGSGPITYSWQKTSGGTIVAVSPSSQSTAFRATVPPDAGGSFQCVATRGGFSVTSSPVAVQVKETAAPPPLSVTLSTYTVTASGPAGTVTTQRVYAYVTGGDGSPVAYSWHTLGRSGITATTPTSSSTTFSGTVPPDRSAVFWCNASQGGGLGANSPDCAVSITATAPPPLQAQASPASVFGAALPGNTATSQSSTVSTTGGGSGFTGYLWQRVSGDTSIAVNGGSTATASFSAVMGSMQKTAVFRCRVQRDGETVYTNNVSITLEPLL